MTTLENRGTLSPEVSEPREGYKQLKVGFWGGQPEILDSRMTGYAMSDIERDIISGISEKLKVRSEKKKIDSLVDGYLVKGYHTAKKNEEKPVKHHRIISKLIDFAIVVCLAAEILTVIYIK